MAAGIVAMVWQRSGWVLVHFQKALCPRPFLSWRMRIVAVAMLVWEADRMACLVALSMLASSGGGMEMDRPLCWCLSP